MVFIVFIVLATITVSSASMQISFLLQLFEAIVTFIEVNVVMMVEALVAVVVMPYC